MEASKSLIGLVFVMIMVSSISTSESYVFSVGDRFGWVENPPVPYNNWAGSKRFSINDTLVFNNKGQDSVLVVKKESYDSCNLSSPIQTLSGGKSEYKLDHSGPHYFISSAAGHCSKGQKMIVVVLAVRNKPVPSPPATPTPSTPSPSPSPPATPTPSTPSPSPTPSTPPSPSPSPSPSTPTPLVSSPSPTPYTPTPSIPSPSPSPTPSTPTPSTPSPSPTPYTPTPAAPSPSPTPYTPTPSAPTLSPTPSTTAPSTPSPSSTPSTPAPSTPSTPTPSTPVSPPPPKTPSSSSIFRVSRVSMGLVALVLGAVLN